jgi:ubiquinone/menaquinone biosynthesis C-methylase UbiE
MEERGARIKLDYGFDGSPIQWPLICLGAWALCLPMLISSTMVIRIPGILLLVLSLCLTYLIIKMYYYVHFGKLRLRDHLLAMATLHGNESVLDIGTGRGLLMIGAAKLVPGGKSVGIDIWSQVDMKDNDPKDTLRNAEIEGVLSRVEVKSEDVRKMSFSDGSFDVVLSNLCIHNIPSKQGREQACHEIERVLKHNGVAVIADIIHINDYARVFAEKGFSVEIVRPSFSEVVTPWHKILKAVKK